MEGEDRQLDEDDDVALAITHSVIAGGLRAAARAARNDRDYAALLVAARHQRAAATARLGKWIARRGNTTG